MTHPHTHEGLTRDGQPYRLDHTGLHMTEEQDGPVYEEYEAQAIPDFVPSNMSAAHAVAETTDASFEWSLEYQAKLDDLLKLHNMKANDYTAGAVDPLFNYRMAALVANVDTPAIMLARIQEKVTRLASLFLVDQQVLSESRRDTLMDIANIALLIANELDRRMWHYDNKTDAAADFQQALKERGSS